MKKVITLLALLVSFSGFSQSFQLNEFVNLLKKIDPANSSKYEQILN